MQSISIAKLLMPHIRNVDDGFYQGQILLQGKSGRKPRFRDSEVITLMLAQDYIPYPGENQFIGYIKANYADWFPNSSHKASSIDVLGIYVCWLKKSVDIGC